MRDAKTLTIVMMLWGLKQQPTNGLLIKSYAKSPKEKETALQLLAPPFLQMAFGLPGLDGKNEGDKKSDGNPAPADAYQARP